MGSSWWSHLVGYRDDVQAEFRGFGRCALLHDGAGTPDGLSFWGRSGD